MAIAAKARKWMIIPVCIAAGAAGGAIFAPRSATADIPGYEVVGTSKLIANNTEDALAATCPSGKQVIGGGYVGGVGRTIVIAEQMLASPSSGPVNTWFVDFENYSSNAVTVQVFAVCADVL